MWQSKSKGGIIDEQYGSRRTYAQVEKSPPPVNRINGRPSTDNNPRADGAKRRARVLIPPGYLHPGKQKH
jgi:hypothetical protein